MFSVQWYKICDFLKNGFTEQTGWFTVEETCCTGYKILQPLERTNQSTFELTLENCPLLLTRAAPPWGPQPIARNWRGKYYPPCPTPETIGVSRRARRRSKSLDEKIFKFAQNCISRSRSRVKVRSNAKTVSDYRLWGQLYGDKNELIRRGSKKEFW